MPKTLKLLLTENVDNLGIVGDVVTVRTGYARNFLLPREMATQPSEEAVRAVAAKRAAAEKALKEERATREEMIGRLQGQELTLTRSCNDQGHLYAAVTQQDIAGALGTLGFAVRPREVRLAQTIKRIDSYDVQVKFDADLQATIKVWVVADRKLDLDEDREEMEFDNEGNLIVKPPKEQAAAPAEGAAPAKEGEAPRPREKKRETAISSRLMDKGPNPMERKIVDWTKSGAKASEESAPADGEKSKGKKDKAAKGEKKAKG